MQKLSKTVKVPGVVTSGDKVGRTIGFPTANLDIPLHDLSIKLGVYAALVKLETKTYLGLAYFGPRYIQGEHQNSFEVFLLNFNQDLYGKKLTVTLTHFIRSPKKITSLSKLKTELKKDQAQLDDYTILINQKDQIIGIKKILEAHLNPPQLHRASSVLIFNPKGELLVQQRSKHKPLWPLYWSNTSCTNHRPGESYHTAAERCLLKEMGLKTKLKLKWQLPYKAKFNHRLSEYEITSIFFGITDKKPEANPKEAADYKYISMTDLKKDLKLKSKKYTPWFKLIMKRLSPSDILTS